MIDKEFLKWLHGRMCSIHGENPYMDYMHKFRAIIETIPDGQVTPNFASTLEWFERRHATIVPEDIRIDINLGGEAKINET